MDKKELLKRFRALCLKMEATVKKKNADYSGTSEDPFFNFTMVEKLDVCETEIGFLVKMTDKFARTISFVKQRVLQVIDESVEDTLLDFASYCILFLMYIQSKEDD